MVKRNRQRGRPRSLDYVPPFIERNIPYFDFCSLEQLEAIEAHVDWLLADVGVEFRQDPKALDILRAGGGGCTRRDSALPRWFGQKVMRNNPE